MLSQCTILCCKHVCVVSMQGIAISDVSTTQDGYTPLIVAAECGQCDVLNDLIEHGAYINAQRNVSHSNTHCHDAGFEVYVHHLSIETTLSNGVI